MENQEYEEQISRIFRYKDSLTRHAEDENHGKIQYYIEKLRKMPIKYEHLDQTRIGNLVNQIRSKFDGRTKELAKKCVNEWKGIVSEYEAATAEEEEEEEREIERQEKAAAAAAAEAEAQKKRLKKEEQERIAAQESKHHSEASSSHHRDSGSKHKSKRSHTGDDDHHSKKPRKDKHHKSQDHHRSSKHDDEKKKHGSEEDRHKSKSKESKDKPKEQTKKDKSKDKKSSSSSSGGGSSKSKSVINVINGIDSGSGASFAEALGMCEPSGSKTTPVKKEATKKKLVASPEKKAKCEKEKPGGSSSASRLPSSKPPPKSHHSPPPLLDLNDSLPKLLKQPIAALEPVDLNISSLLPTITPNYRPMGNHLTMSDVAAKKLSDYEALSNIITSKNQRTKVYSGNKCAQGKVPSLFDMCIRILQDNIDSLEFTGGVPFHILKPILDKASPNQLYLLEHHNPYLIEDTDDMWRLHCQKDFRNKPRLELESWREMYMRCLDEREAKLIALTANIKQAQDKSVPVRKAKLAFVDDIAKPPRNIARQQAKHGTGKQFDKRPLVTPSSRLSTLTSLATAGEAGKVSVPNPGARAAERSGASVNKPAKKAPLMAKSLSLLKNRFKR